MYLMYIRHYAENEKPWDTLPYTGYIHQIPPLGAQEEEAEIGKKNRGDGGHQKNKTL